MAVKTYNAGVKEYRQTYWTPEYTPLDTDILACFKITPQPGVDREEVAAAVAAESSTGTWTTVWTDLLTDLDYYKGRAYRIEDVPGDDTCFYAFVAYPIDLFEEGSVVNVLTSLVGNVFGFKALRALRPGGRLVSFGATTGRTTEVDIRHVFWNQLSILGTTMGSPQEFASMLILYEAGRLKPVVDSVFPLRDAAEAHRRMEQGQQFGKIVLVP